MARRARERAAAKRKRAKRRTFTGVAVAAVFGFTAILGGLSLQMASGEDPALANKAAQYALNQNPRTDRKIVKRNVTVRKVYEDDDNQQAATAQSQAAPSSGTGYSGSSTASTPSYSAPAPAPVTSSAS